MRKESPQEEAARGGAVVPPTEVRRLQTMWWKTPDANSCRCCCCSCWCCAVAVAVVVAVAVAVVLVVVVLEGYRFLIIIIVLGLGRLVRSALGAYFQDKLRSRLRAVHIFKIAPASAPCIFS